MTTGIAGGLTLAL